MKNQDELECVDGATYDTIVISNTKTCIIEIKTATKFEYAVCTGTCKKTKYIKTTTHIDETDNNIIIVVVVVLIVASGLIVLVCCLKKKPRQLNKPEPKPEKEK